MKYKYITGKVLEIDKSRKMGFLDSNLWWSSFVSGSKNNYDDETIILKIQKLLQNIHLKKDLRVALD